MSKRYVRAHSILGADTRFSKMAAYDEVSGKDQRQDLDQQYLTLKRQILRYQSPTLGLFPRVGLTEEPSKLGYVRDSVYCAAASWALSQAYRRIDNDSGRTHELAQVAVKCMRGILYCWIRQADKVEKFKANQSADHALHSVFDLLTGDPVFKDDEYEHLQIDVVGLYLIFLVQMITSGLQIIFTTDEVNFVQNLVFYVERAYRTPDYGMWERGSKYNNGSTEIHASSIGLAKAALEAINGVNLYGNQGASWSVIFVDIDAHNRNRTIFESILPRESNSKNTDASLLPTVSWPAFSIHEEPIRSRTIDKVIRKLLGRRGIKRFIRDGYKTVMEDKNRKYYKPAEIKNFDGIECEWPMFFVYLLIDCIFHGDKEGVEKYSKMLEVVMCRTNDGLLMPQYFYISEDSIEMERATPRSAERIPSDVGSREGVFLWGQAIYFISQLLVKELLNIGELDPIRRHLPASERPKFNTRYSSFQLTPPDLVVQVVLISESSRLQQLLATYGIQTQTPHQIEPIQIWSPKELSRAYEYLGINKKLGITGRPKRPFGVLSTSKIYRACGATVLCYPLLFEVSDFYMAQDVSIIIDDLKNDLAFLSKCWKLAGRPTFCMLIRENNIRGQNFSEFLDLLAQFKSGDVDGVKVRVGRLQSLISSSCLEHLDFLSTLPDPSIFQPFEGRSYSGTSSFKSLTDIPQVTELSDESTLDEQIKGKRKNQTSCHDMAKVPKREFQEKDFVWMKIPGMQMMWPAQMVKLCSKLVVAYVKSDDDKGKHAGNGNESLCADENNQNTDGSQTSELGDKRAGNDNGSLCANENNKNPDGGQTSDLGDKHAENVVCADGNNQNTDGGQIIDLGDKRAGNGNESVCADENNKNTDGRQTTDGSLKQAESYAECTLRQFLLYFQPALSVHLSSKLETAYGDLKSKPTWDLVNILKCVESLQAQSQILKTLLFREGLNFHLEGITISRKLEELVTRASVHKRWEVVRLCSALLGKLVDSLAPSVTSILVRGKHLTVGVFGHEEEVLDKPVSPNEIKYILYNKCMPYDICQAVLQQELILAIGKHIATSPEQYDGILKIRIGWFVQAMEMELELQDEGVKLASLSPYQVKQLMLSILTKNEQSDMRTPLQRRQLDGALSRVPKDFYERVWEILERTPGGIKVAGYLLPQHPTLSDMTMQELNFSLLVEQMLSKIVDPAYRQIMVETFMVVSTILRRNPELLFHQSVHMDKTIQDAFDEFQRDLSRLEGHEKQDDMKRFFNTQPNVKHGTTSYLVKAVVKNLLDGDIKVSMDDMCCIS